MVLFRFRAGQAVFRAHSVGILVSNFRNLVVGFSIPNLWCVGNEVMCSNVQTQCPSCPQLPPGSDVQEQQPRGGIQAVPGHRLLPVPVASCHAPFQTRATMTELPILQGTTGARGRKGAPSPGTGSTTYTGPPRRSSGPKEEGGRASRGGRRRWWTGWGPREAA